MSACAAIAQSNIFNVAIILLILANAVVLGLDTYPSFHRDASDLLYGLEWVFRVAFLAELAIRIGAHGNRPQDFLRSGWNLFDLVVVLVAFVPGIAANSTLLRLARLARVLRVLRFFPALRTILVSIGRSVPGVAGFLAVSVLTLYMYGMVGWMLFGDVYPREFGTVGRAVLTLFLLLSLETLPDAIAMGLAVSPWTLVYFVSYVVVASYLLVNVLVGVVINSMEETRRAELARQETSSVPARSQLDPAAVERRLAELRAAIAALEAELRVRRD